MIIAHLEHDIPTLRACTITCFVWYNVASPRIHQKLKLRESSLDVSNPNPTPLSSLLKHGLLALVKNLELEISTNRWAIPTMFDSRNMRYFHAMVNLQELRVAYLDFSEFPAGFGTYLGHFSPTLRSIALSHPRGRRRQLLDFFRLFPRLDDIEVSDYPTQQEPHEALDSQLTPMNGGLRGCLVLNSFGDEGLLRDIIDAFGGIRFTSMDLRNVRGARILSEACANTLETLRTYAYYCE